MWVVKLNSVIQKLLLITVNTWFIKGAITVSAECQITIVFFSWEMKSLFKNCILYLLALSFSNIKVCFLHVYHTYVFQIIKQRIQEVGKHFFTYIRFQVGLNVQHLLGISYVFFFKLLSINDPKPLLTPMAVKYTALSSLLFIFQCCMWTNKSLNSA